MQTSGLVLDVYDDVHGSVIRGLFSSLDAVPELLKTAQAISPADRERLPDDAFALVLLNGEERLRKYACTDAGNTALSVFYFLENSHKLPEAAQKTAAANLVTACGWYDLAVPETLEKAAGIVSAVGNAAVNRAVANPVGTGLTAMVAPSLVRGTKESIRSNLARAAEETQMAKLNEASGTELMPSSNNTRAKLQGTMTQSIKKTGSMTPVVDVTGQQRPEKLTVKQAKHYALPLEQKYPLDSYEQVKTASAYYEEFGKRFSPEVRREYCVNLVKRAEDLNVSLPYDVTRYGSLKLASAEEFEVAVHSRSSLLEHSPDLQQVLHKIAGHYWELNAPDMCRSLLQFDKLAGLDWHYGHDVPDPYYSVFGREKTAEEDFHDMQGNEHIRGHELKSFSLSARKQIVDTFGDDFADEFQKDPIAIYKSMPMEQKKMIRRMATENSPGV